MGRSTEYEQSNRNDGGGSFVPRYRAGGGILTLRSSFPGRETCSFRALGGERRTRHTRFRTPPVSTSPHEM